MRDTGNFVFLDAIEGVVVINNTNDCEAMATIEAVKGGPAVVEMDYCQFNLITPQPEQQEGTNDG